MKTICYFAIACLILCVGPAKANWQYTKWGMTPEELLALGNGKIVKASPDEASPNVAKYKGHRGTTMTLNAELALAFGLLVEGISYKAFYYFNSTGLFWRSFQARKTALGRANSWMRLMVPLIARSVLVWMMRTMLEDASSGDGGERRKMVISLRSSICAALALNSATKLSRPRAACRAGLAISLLMFSVALSCAAYRAFVR